MNKVSGPLNWLSRYAKTIDLIQVWDMVWYEIVACSRAYEIVNCDLWLS